MGVILLKVLNYEGLQRLVAKIKASTVACAEKLSNTSAIGSATKPVYFNANGVPVAGTYTLGAACAKGVSTSVTSGDSNLVTGGAVSSAISAATNYEEGTFTPKFWNSSNVEQTFAEVHGYYKRIGNLCYIHIYAIVFSSVSVYYIDNLPFAPNSTIHAKSKPSHEQGTVFANGKACCVNVPYAHGQINLSSVATGILLVEGIYNI